MKSKMMKNNSLAILTIALFMMSCADKNTVNMKISDLNGLKEKSLVLSKGKEVGEVIEISFFNGKYLNVLLELDKDFYIPIGSQAALVSTDILGTRAISIELSDNDDYYSSLDTLLCIDKSATKLDTTLMRINTVIEEITDSIPKLIKEKHN
jgi:ABC-type transporter Mla subunit MlaD